jgi:hypothetical protein
MSGSRIGSAHCSLDTDDEHTQGPGERKAELRHVTSFAAKVVRAYRSAAVAPPAGLFPVVDDAGFYE